MDANVKIVLDDYFEHAEEFAQRNPNQFVPVRGNRVSEPLITAFFSETEPFTLTASDDQEIFAGDILVYPKTRQFCYIDDIRHIPDKNVFIIHYCTKFDAN